MPPDKLLKQLLTIGRLEGVKHGVLNRERTLRRRIRLLTWLFIFGLAPSGVTAIPLPSELDWLVQLTGARQLVEAPASTAPVGAWARRA